MRTAMDTNLPFGTPPSSPLEGIANQNEIHPFHPMGCGEMENHKGLDKPLAMKLKIC